MGKKPPKYELKQAIMLAVNAMEAALAYHHRESLSAMFTWHEIERQLREAMSALKNQSGSSIVQSDLLGQLLCLIDPAPIVRDDKMYVFHNPHAAEVLTKISALVRQMVEKS